MHGIAHNSQQLISYIPTKPSRTMKTKLPLSRTFNPRGYYTAMLAAFVFLASSNLFAQVKIGTNPTTIDPNSNLEVEASTAGRKTSVHKVTGQVTIQDGTQGVGKVFTSDANGGGSWQSATQFIFYGVTTNTSASPYTVVSGLGGSSLGQRIPFTPSFGASYDAVNKQYLIPADGYYRLTAGVRCVGTTAGQEAAQFVLRDGQFTPSDFVTTLTTGSSSLRSFTTVGFYAANTSVYYYVNNQSGTDVGCYGGFLAVEKITPP
jgi:hypothetical protein